MDINDENDNMSQEAVDSIKRGTHKVQDFFRRKASGLIARGGKAAAHMGFKALKTFFGVVLKMIVAMGPISLIVLGVLIFLGLIFTWQLDERGTSGQLDQHYKYENPVITKDGVTTAVALTEPQALIDAYYKYMACDSHQKVYIDENGNEVLLQFSDSDETSDFAALMDMQSKENYFYLSSYFIKMTDELLHRGEFYYPEQIIKPVFAKALPVENPDEQERGKKYITTLPLVDDGSPNAEALKNGKQAYAISKGTDGTEFSSEKREPPTDAATLAMLAESNVFMKETITQKDADGNILKDENGNPKKREAFTKQNTQMSTAGIWDYGFGSILQYEPGIKDKFIQCQFTRITIHCHFWYIKGYTEDGMPIWDTKCRGTAGNKVISLSAGETAASLQEKISAYNQSPGSGNTVVEVQPSSGQLERMTNTEYNQHVEMKVQIQDEKLAKRGFDNASLNAAFGNNKTPGTADYIYPLKVATISSAATFSGNIRYKYTQEKTSAQMRVEKGSFTDNYNEDYTDLVYCYDTDDNCVGADLICVRSGLIWDEQPCSVPEEITEPIGFQYLEDYDSHYQIYVPDMVRTDMDFQERVNAKQPGAYKTALDANKDGRLTVMDFLQNLGLLKPYAGGTLSAVGGGSLSGELTESEQELMGQANVSGGTEGEIELLAKVIMAEAAPNKLDQLMVASVVMNRVYDSRFPNTLIGVITAPNQYESWANGSIQKKVPSEQALSSARQVMSGEFAIPANIVFQKVGAEGKVFMITQNGRPFYDHTYSISRYDSTFAQTDRFGRTALTAAQVRDLASKLNDGDVSAGYSPSTSDNGIAYIEGEESAEGYELNSDYPLYAVTGFDVLTAIQNMQQFADRDGNPNLIHQFANFVTNAFNSVKEQILGFFSYVEDAFGSNHKDSMYIMFNHDVPLQTMYDSVIQAITFSDQETYSNIADSIDVNERNFIFIGKEGGIGAGTNGMGTTIVAGTGSSFEGFTSPTANHYQTISPWDEITGSVTLSAPEGTIVQSVGPGKVTGVKENDGIFEVTMTSSSGGKQLKIVYGGLKEASVAEGQSVRKGDKIGLVGADGLVLSLYINGKNVNPMEYFYRPVYSSGAAFMNILDENGFVDENLKNQLAQSLNAANSNVTNIYDSYHQNPPNGKTPGECTWWAWGRGLQYCRENGTEPQGGLPARFGNGGDYYDVAQNNGIFAVGQKPRAGSWVVWKKISDPTGNYYGHVAFVEAVEADGSIWISESGQSIWRKNKGNGILVRKIHGPNYVYGKTYQFRGFVYLDSPLK